jgi:hypothetical protein
MVIRNIRSKRMELTGHAAHVVYLRNAYTVLVISIK